MAQSCEHAGVHWYLDPCKEAGWRCLDCATTLGYRPDLDRGQTYRKVSAVLHELHQREIIYVSNATEGDLVTADVAQQCRAVDTYDQWSIAGFILEHPDMDHAEFWHDEAQRWLANQGAGGRGPGAEEPTEEREQKGRDGGTD